MGSPAKTTHLLITGGPGAGASTLGKVISEALDAKWVDSDTYFHKPTEPPFQEQYPKPERNRLIHEALEPSKSWVLSGSISAWEIDDIHFTHAVLLNVGHGVRVARLKARETERFGKRLDKGGDMHDEHVGFMRWAASYETGTQPGRNLPRERMFIDRFCAGVLETDREQPIEDLVPTVTRYVRQDLLS